MSIFDYSLKKDYFLETALGDNPAGSSFMLFAHNPSIGTSETYLSELGVTAPFMPTTATQVEIISTSMNDSAAGSGAQSVVMKLVWLEGKFVVFVIACLGMLEAIFKFYNLG